MEWSIEWPNLHTPYLFWHNCATEHPATKCVQVETNPAGQWSSRKYTVGILKRRPARAWKGRGNAASQTQRFRDRMYWLWWCNYRTIKFQDVWQFGNVMVIFPLFCWVACHHQNTKCTPNQDITISNWGDRASLACSVFMYSGLSIFSLVNLHFFCAQNVSSWCAAELKSDIRNYVFRYTGAIYTSRTVLIPI
jgi:hypothetical protein